MTTRKLQFAEEGPTLQVESYELSKTLRWCERLINSIVYLCSYNRCTQEIWDSLTATARHKIDRDGILATRLCTHKEDVNQINEIHLQKLNSEFSSCYSVDLI